MTDKVQILVEGITHSDSTKAFYIVSMKEVNGERRFPIVIGQHEAQAIAVAHEHLLSPRPNAYDVCSTIANVFDITVREVYIHDRRNGVFYTSIILRRDLQTEEVDARPSDAIAFALRTNAPIYVNRQLFDVISINPNEGHVRHVECPLDELDKKQLTLLLDEAVNREEYERAAAIRDILKTKV